MQATRSGWIPAALVVALAAALLHGAAQVSLVDQARFAGYLLGWIVLPGTIIWRSLDRRPERPMAEDLALGALVGYVVEFPVYLSCLALGHPHGYLLWPVLVGGVTLALPAGRRLLVRRGPRLSPAWSWSVAGLLAYVVLWFGHNVWGPSPAAGPTLRQPYLDEPFHLSLIASLRHFWPAKVLFVDHTPLDYHFLSHTHMAAASWISGVPPIVLLRALAMPTVIVLVLLALAAAATRLSGRTWLGPVALAGVLVSPANFSSGSDGSGFGFLDLHLQISPSAGFTNAGLLLGTVLVVELLRKENSGPGLWALTWLTMVAMCGAKAASLPTVLAGLALATVVTSLADRKIAYRPLALTALAGVAFLAAKSFFFGSSAQGLYWDPLGGYATYAAGHPGLAGASGVPTFGVKLLIALSTLGALSLLGGVLVGLGKRGWREPAPLFLAGLCASGYAAALCLHQVGNSEGYFIIVVQLPMILAAALGFARYRDDLARWGGRRLVLIALAAGLAAGLVYTAITSPVGASVREGSAAALATRLFVLPLVVVLLVTAALAAVIVLALRRRAAGTPVLPAFAVVAALVLVGIGAAPTAHRLDALVKDPVPAPVASSHGLIGHGGIAAADYLKARVPLDGIVATNAHCTTPGTTNDCSARNFWMAGYTERQYLVEGWSYISRASVGLPAPKAENITSSPFWDPSRLAQNDAAFTDPSPATLGRLENHYGVHWLLVDMRYPVDLPGLRRNAHEMFADHAYLVFHLG